MLGIYMFNLFLIKLKLKNMLLRNILFCLLVYIPLFAQKNTPIGLEIEEISAQDRGGLWQLSTNFRIYKHITGKTWEEHPSQSHARSIFVGVDGGLYGIGYDDLVHKSTGNDWVEVGSRKVKAAKVTTDATGKVWMIGLNKRIYFFNKDQWVEYAGNGFAKEIITNKAGQPVHIGLDGRVYIGTEKGWTIYSDGCPKAQTIIFDEKGNLWLIDKKQNKIYRQIAPNKWEVFDDSIKAKDIAILGKTLYYIHYWNNDLYETPIVEK
jgi:hypothetical protein